MKYITTNERMINKKVKDILRDNIAGAKIAKAYRKYIPLIGGVMHIKNEDGKTLAEIYKSNGFIILAISDPL